MVCGLNLVVWVALISSWRDWVIVEDYNCLIFASRLLFLRRSWLILLLQFLILVLLPGLMSCWKWINRLRTLVAAQHASNLSKIAAVVLCGQNYWNCRWYDTQLWFLFRLKLLLLSLKDWLGGVIFLSTALAQEGLSLLVFLLLQFLHLWIIKTHALLLLVLFLVEG